MKIGYADVDLEREKRTGVPEIIYGEGKNAAEIEGIIKILQDAGIKIYAGASGSAGVSGWTGCARSWTTTTCRVWISTTIPLRCWISAPNGGRLAGTWWSVTATTTEN